jgi:hypothetical protein
VLTCYKCWMLFGFRKDTATPGMLSNLSVLLYLYSG